MDYQSRGGGKAFLRQHEALLGGVGWWVILNRLKKQAPELTIWFAAPAAIGRCS
jgi:hypothetical protein